MREIKLKKATLQKQQYELQENLLKDLSSNSDILHDANLLASLNKTRSSSSTIAEALKAARNIEEQTREACEAFEQSAKKTAVLALAVKELTGHRPLVALPVEAVLEVYVEAVKRGGNDPKNLNNPEIIRYVTRRIIERVLLGLHKRDKYTVVMHLLKQVYDHVVSEELWKIFIGNIEFIDDQSKSNEIKQTYPWLTEEGIRKLISLQLSSPDLFNTLQSNCGTLKQFNNSGELNTLSGLKLGQFENIVAVGIFRPASLYRAIVAFVDQILGVGVMSAGNEIQNASRWGIYGARGPRPLLLLGAHAADQLATHAAATANKLTQTLIDSGRGEWERTVEANRSGGWVALSVGASPFSSELQAFLTSLAQTTNNNFSPEFRLWIVSEDRDIPPLVSNACVNIILEAPEGIKNNVMNTLSAWGNFESGDLKLVRLHAGLAWLHALLQERRAYIPEGWSRWYPFEWGDVSACARIIRTVGAGDASRGLVESIYGGRVGARPDRELLATMVNECLGEHTFAHSWRPRGVDVQLPFGKQLQAYASALSALPSIDSPEVLGLPADCRAAWEAKAAVAVLDGLRELNTAVGVNKITDNSATLKPLLALWKKLMAGNPLLKGDHFAEMSGWWGLVCSSEARRGAAAVRAVHSSLSALAKQKNSAALLKVPEEWQVAWSGPDAPEQYVKEVAHRAAAAVRRAQHYTADHFPYELDLREYFDPRLVLGALRAAAAAARCLPPAALALKTTWGNDASPPGEGEVCARLVGLRLCGAAWQRALRPAPAHEPAPHILLRYVQRDDSSVSAGGGGGGYPVPLYGSARRSAELLTARAPLAPPPDAARARLNAVALVVPAV